MTLSAATTLETDLAGDGAGGAYFAWEDSRRGPCGCADVYLLHLGPDGQPMPGWPADGRLVASIADQPRIASLGPSGILVSWRQGGTGEIGVFALHVLPDGQAASGWPENGKKVASFPVVPVDLQTDGAGGGYLLLQQSPPPFQPYGFFIQHFDASGAIVPGWGSDGHFFGSGSDERRATSLAANSAGVIVAWKDHTLGETLATKLNPDGSVATGWSPAGIAISSLGNLDEPKVIGDGMGGAFISLRRAESYGIVQHLTGTGAVASGWPLTGIGIVPFDVSTQYDLEMTPDGFGGFVVAWRDDRTGGQGGIRAQRYSGSGPTAVQAALISVQAEPELVRLVWNWSGPRGASIAAFRRSLDGGVVSVGHSGIDGSGRILVEDRSIQDNTRYVYWLEYAADGITNRTEEVVVEIPESPTLELAAISPNPVVGDATVAFRLGSSEGAQLDVIDLGGRRVMSHDLRGRGAGEHRVTLSLPGGTAPGIYWLRLAQGDQIRRAKMILSR